MTTQQPEALRLAAWLKPGAVIPVDIETTTALWNELRRLHHNNFVLTNALWKACGDDEEVVNATIESQGEMK